MKKFMLTILFLGAAVTAYAQDKDWNAVPGQTKWFDEANWLPAAVPGASDDVTLDKLDASSVIDDNFNVRSLTLGGKKETLLTVNNFVAGEVKPQNATDIAVLNRRGGVLVLKGSAGKLTLKGAYKDSEEIIPEEPSLMFYVQ